MNLTTEYVHVAPQVGNWVWTDPVTLTQDLLGQCSSENMSDEPSAELLYYDLASIQEKPYLLAVMAVREQVRWVAAELAKGASIPSMAKNWPAMLWPERELAQKSQRQVTGHPDLQPVFHPHQFLPSPRSTGAGVFTLPLGPVRADVTESAFFLFETVGEQIMHLQPQLFYKHRNIEGLARGQSLEYGLLLAERVSGTSSFNHAFACAQAVEQALKFTVSPYIHMERLLFSELERLYNHVHDLAQIASAAGMTVGQAQLARAKEELLRINAQLVHSRYLHGAVVLFGSSGIDWATLQEDLQRQLQDINQRVQYFVRLLRKTPTFVDRLVGTGIVTGEWAQQYALVGPVARACGICTDTRQRWAESSDAEIPNVDWDALGYRISVSERQLGDAKDRFDVRVAEWQVSMEMIRNLLAKLAGDDLTYRGMGAERRGNNPTSGWGIGIAEGPRGRIAYVVHVKHRKIAHFGIKSASAWNWPVFGLATANGNIQTDFPVIDASFGLSYAGMDR